MKRTISSSLTVVYGFLFPLVWIGGFGLATVALFSRGDPKKWMFLTALLVGALFLSRFCLPLKRVTIEGSDLLISNFLRTIRVPLGQVFSVKENALINIHPVYIRFQEPTAFGFQIVFMPEVRMFSLFGSHPIVAELMTLAKDARSQAQKEHP